MSNFIIKAKEMEQIERSLNAQIFSKKTWWDLAGLSETQIPQPRNPFFVIDTINELIQNKLDEDCVEGEIVTPKLTDGK